MPRLRWLKELSTPRVPLQRSVLAAISCWVLLTGMPGDSSKLLDISSGLSL